MWAATADITLIGLKKSIISNWFSTSKRERRQKWEDPRIIRGLAAVMRFACKSPGARNFAGRSDIGDRKKKLLIGKLIPFVINFHWETFLSARTRGKCIVTKFSDARKLAFRHGSLINISHRDGKSSWGRLSCGGRNDPSPRGRQMKWRKPC